MSLEEEIQQAIDSIKASVVSSEQDLQFFKNTYIGKKSLSTRIKAEIKEASPADKPALGKLLKLYMGHANEMYATHQHSLESKQERSEDLTKPAWTGGVGSRHPISLIVDKVCSIFQNIGYDISEGPEIETDWYNYTALNFEADHPARDMQDTFFVHSEQAEDIMLRSHTSSVQIRHMLSHTPPIRTISPGRVFRNEAISSRSHCIFHQIEGLCVDKRISFADLKKVISYFTQAMFGKAKIRFRPSYFPFTEPSAEVDVYWGLETEVDYRITKGTGWLEIMGCGMVDPAVFANVDIDPEQYSGFAFGMGVERMALLLYDIPDIRLLFQNQDSFLRQFPACAW